MMRFVFLSWLLTVALLAAHAPARADGADAVPMSRDDPIGFCRAVQEQLLDGAFDRLETTAAEARNLERRFIGGQTELEVLYRGLTQSDCVWSNTCAVDGAFETRNQRLQEWLDRRSDATTASVAMARLWYYGAWQARGCGYASEISQKQWREFAERLKIAADHARGLDANQDPEAGRILLALSRDFNLPPDQISTIFERIRQRFPTYLPYYREYTNMMEEKWSGRRDLLPAFVTSLLRDPGGDTGDVAYSIAAEWLASDMETSRLYSGETGLDWKNLRRAYATRERLYGLGSRDWTMLCYFAVAASDRDAAREAFRHFVTKLEYWPWSGNGHFYNEVVPWILSRDDRPTDGPSHRRR